MLCYVVKIPSFFDPQSSSQLLSDFDRLFVGECREIVLTLEITLKKEEKIVKIKSNFVISFLKKEVGYDTSCGAFLFKLLS